MPDKARPTEAEIRYAIEYALRSEPISVWESDDEWGEGANLSASDLEPFTMRLLQQLNVI